MNTWKFKIPIITLLSISLFGHVSAQKVQFSQTDNLSLFDNPSYSAYFQDDKNPNHQLSIRYRDQFRQFASPAYRTLMLEGNFPLYYSSLDSWNMGLVLQNDNSNNGLFKQNLIGLQLGYARKFSSSRSSYTKVSTGLLFSYESSNFNTLDLWFGKQYDTESLDLDPTLSSGEPLLRSQVNYFNFNLGLAIDHHFSAKNYLKAGLALHHINQPDIGNISSETLGIRTQAFAEFMIGTSRSLYQGLIVGGVIEGPYLQIQPGYKLLYDVSGRGDTKLRTSLATRFSKTTAGLSLNAIVLAFGLESTQWYGLLSYDVSTSSLNESTPSNGAIELSLGYFLFSDR